jgi:hypothetical protein
MYKYTLLFLNKTHAELAIDALGDKYNAQEYTVAFCSDCKTIALRTNDAALVIDLGKILSIIPA